MSDVISKKIEKELYEYVNFKKEFQFTFKDIINKGNIQYCDGFPIYDEEGNYIPECNKWINVGYKIKNSLSKLLSNLYPYEFVFRNFHLKSIEAFFQCIKFKDPIIQQMIFNYYGTDAYHIQATSHYDWKETGYIYWQGNPIKRDSSEYDMLVDELYISAAQNPLYRQALKTVTNPIIHSIGKTLKSETVFTRYEFERELNSLSAFLKHIDQDR